MEPLQKTESATVEAGKTQVLSIAIETQDEWVDGDESGEQKGIGC
jgi:hypothetical protein